MWPLEFTATPATSPKFIPVGSFRRSMFPVNLISGTGVCGGVKGAGCDCARSEVAIRLSTVESRFIGVMWRWGVEGEASILPLRRSFGEWLSGLTVGRPGPDRSRRDSAHDSTGEPDVPSLSAPAPQHPPDVDPRFCEPMVPSHWIAPAPSRGSPARLALCTWLFLAARDRPARSRPGQA